MVFQATIHFQLQDITCIPTRHDGGLTGEGHVAGQGGAEARNVSALGGAIVPPQDLLTHPTRDSERYLPVALAGVVWLLVRQCAPQGLRSNHW